MPRWLKRMLIGLGALAVLAIVLVIAGDWWVGHAAAPFVFTRLQDLPSAPVALVLGTARETNGHPNAFYTARLVAAADLFHHRKVRAILVSGDNSRPDYDEPGAMKADLVRRGVPARYVTCDFAGFRTLDSVVRASEVFGQRRFIVVSQRFHVERAVFLARGYGLEAFGFAASDVGGPAGRAVRAREVLARCQALLDSWVLGTRPRFLGEPVAVPLRPERPE
jgi:SanA protein